MATAVLGCRVCGTTLLVPLEVTTETCSDNPGRVHVTVEADSDLLTAFGSAHRDPYIVSHC